MRPAFLITVDTEGDSMWQRPRLIETRNADHVLRFQQLCERYGFRPTWLTNHEMAISPTFVAFGRDVMRRNAGEIGMHLHAWSCPPDEVALTDDDYRHQPFLIEYPLEQMEAKIAHMTDLLRDRFETSVVSHRAGRWAMDSRYAKLLAKYGYLVDCSVTPHVSWTDTLGAPNGQGGTDYRHYSDRPYFLDLEHIDRPGDSPILELPATVIPGRLYRRSPWAYRVPIVRRFAWRREPPHRWLYPDGTNLSHMLAVVNEAHADGRPYIEFVIHSSELMPGGNELFLDVPAIDALYGDLEVLFGAIARHFVGMTLREFRAAWIEQHAQTAPHPDGLSSAATCP